MGGPRPTCNLDDRISRPSDDDFTTARERRAVSAATEQAIVDAGFTTRRLAGDSRFGTSLEVVEESLSTGASTERLWLASGADWHDALAAAPVAAIRGEIMALVDGDNGPDTSTEVYAAVSAGLSQARVVGDVDSVSRAALDVLHEEFIAEVDPDAIAMQEERRTDTAGMFGGPDWAVAAGILALLGASLQRRRRIVRAD